MPFTNEREGTQRGEDGERGRKEGQGVYKETW
jgi:hypothetical protein